MTHTIRLSKEDVENILLNHLLQRFDIPDVHDSEFICVSNNIRGEGSLDCWELTYDDGSV